MNPVFLIWLFVFLLPLSYGQNDWKLVKDRSDIQVFVRKLDTQDFKEVKITGIVSATLPEVVASLEDVDYHKKWVLKTIDSKILEKKKENDFIYYLSTDMPFPVKDRDVVISYRRFQDEQTGVVHTESIGYADYIPEKYEFVRIPEFKSTYKLIPIKENEVKIEYYLKINPGGLLPPWLVNLAVTRGPIETIESLFEILESGKYQTAVVEDLRDQ
ncbi:MAG: hypothetical protein KJO29_06220 [Bacteroidia bacterium]|nr:hypothetical protein [Bacteroidia bacterium]